MITTLVNLWGGPGCGKSTTAAAVFASLKRRGASAELVTEYVKTWAWRGDTIGPWDDVYLTAKQLRHESALYGKVEYVITDSPLGLGALFERLYKPGQTTMQELCTSLRARQDACKYLSVVDCLVLRTRPYEQSGRWEDEAGARRVDDFAKEQLTALPGGYHVVGDHTDVLTLLERGAGRVG